MTWGCVALLSDSRRRFKNMKLKNRNNWNEENFIFDRYRRSQKRSVICDSIFSRFCCRRFVFKIRDRFVWRLWQLCCFFRRKPRTRPLKSFEANTFKHFFEISECTLTLELVEIILQFFRQIWRWRRRRRSTRRLPVKSNERFKNILKVIFT